MTDVKAPPEWHGMIYSWWIRHNYWNDGFFGQIIEGRQRKGKTSYACQAFAEALSGDPEKPDYEAVKQWLVFPPRDFLQLVLKIDEKQLGIIWDDAGFWLFALDWYEPFVKSVVKYVELVGTQVACVTFTTPSRRLMSQKVMDALPEMYLCRIISEGDDHDATGRARKRRLAKVYETWDYPDGRKGGVRRMWRDHYDAMLPDDFFNWYMPIREKWLGIAKRLLRKEVMLLDKKMSQWEKEEHMELVHEAVGEPSRLKEVEEVLVQLGAK